MEKKRLLFVMNNMCMGGIQKALISLLNELCTEFDITLLLFWKCGPLVDEIPSSVEVVETKSMFRLIGMSQHGCTTFLEKTTRGALVILTRLLGRRAAIELMKPSIRKDKLGDFDMVVSYSHCQASKMFYAGTAEYALYIKNANKRVCYIHCDYENSGTESRENNSIYRKFDYIVCVSQSVRKGFLRVLPDMKERTLAAENPIRKSEIMALAATNQFQYDTKTINMVSVARICQEKGIERVLKALGNLLTRNFKYYVVGDGDRRSASETLVKSLGLTDSVIFLGEDVNPYKYMINADFLVVPSYHEAAPVVFQEAKMLGLPVFTTRTLSADEMIGENYGWVVNNEDIAIERKLAELLEHKEVIDEKKQNMKAIDEKENSITDFYNTLL